MGTAIFLVLMLFIGVAIYFLPFFVSLRNAECNNQLAILVVNLFFGWTLLGWVIAFVMAVWRPAKTAS